MRTKRFLSAVFVSVFMCLCLLFTGCAKLEGTYKFKSLTYTENGMTVELVAGEKFMGALTLSEDFMKITLEDSGVATMVSTTSAGEVATGTWIKGEEKDTVVITFDGEPQTCVCDGKTLTIDVQGVKVVLEKK